MNCQFCYTGRMGLLGNLTTAQIVEQVVEVRPAARLLRCPWEPEEAHGGPSLGGLMRAGNGDLHVSAVGSVSVLKRD